MIDLIMYITTAELIIGSVMYGGTALDWFSNKADNYQEVYIIIMLFLVFSAGHNLIGLGIYGLSRI